MGSLEHRFLSDGYRPAAVPNALKVIAGTKSNPEVEVINSNEVVNNTTGKTDAPFVFTRVGYIYLPTRNLEAAINWYTDKLGLKLTARFEDRGSELAVLQYPHKNAVALLLIESNDAQPLEIIRNGKPFPIAAINCPDIEHTHNILIEKGVVVEPIHSLGEDDAAKYFYFRDQDNNLLEAAWSIWDPVDVIKDEFQ